MSSSADIAIYRTESKQHSLKKDFSRRQNMSIGINRREFVGVAAGAVVVIALGSQAFAQQRQTSGGPADPTVQEKKYKPLSVKAPDGVMISAQEWGNPNGPEIVFVHGFSQASLSWARQVRSELARDFRMITYDLRGHGNSDKPLEREKYQEPKYWADELKAVMDAASLKRPVLVGWSYGGRIISDYVSVHGTTRLAGLSYVDAVSKTDPSFFGPAVPLSVEMSSDVLATNIAATRAFLRNCFEKQPTQDDFEEILAFNMMVPPKVRANMGGRQLNIDDLLRKLDLPVLVTQGEQDRFVLPAMSKHTAETIPGAKLSIYPGVGHSSFYEDAPRFNSELATFVRSANGISKNI
jgi:non-heme chloroperoxidase